MEMTHSRSFLFLYNKLAGDFKHPIYLQEKTMCGLYGKATYIITSFEWFCTKLVCNYICTYDGGVINLNYLSSMFCILQVLYH